MASGLFDFTSPIEIQQRARDQFISAINNFSNPQAQAGFALGGSVARGLSGPSEELTAARETEQLVNEATKGLDVENPAALREAAKKLSSRGRPDLALQLVDRANTVEKNKLTMDAAREQLTGLQQGNTLGKLNIATAQKEFGILDRKNAAALKAADLQNDRLSLEILNLQQALSAPDTSAQQAKKLESELKEKELRVAEIVDKAEKTIRDEYSTKATPLVKGLQKGQQALDLINKDTVSSLDLGTALVAFRQAQEPNSAVLEGERQGIVESLGALNNLEQRYRQAIGTPAAPQILDQIRGTLQTIQDTGRSALGTIDRNQSKIASSTNVPVRLQQIRPADLDVAKWLPTGGRPRGGATPQDVAERVTAAAGAGLPSISQAALESAKQSGITFLGVE